MLGESPLLLAGEPSPPPRRQHLSALSDFCRVWKRDMANVRSVYQKPRRKLGFDGRKWPSKVKGWSGRLALLRHCMAIGPPKATKGVQRRSKGDQKSPKVDPKATKSRPMSPKGHQKSTKGDTKATKSRLKSPKVDEKSTKVTKSRVKSAKVTKSGRKVDQK